ncbi:CDP-diacylglycerol--glycerol-3-phosphate 3-phosphatidyltransferase [Candidatus Methylomirabilis limnetica]|nr:CDP-diacylglycerol--glycerol-3-phosphate 3-phosphatidyltransferase [Candidatus Methylomirabilis limnetica]
MEFARDFKGRRALMNLPNKITLGRIFLVPFIIVFLVVGEKVPNYTAGAIFLAAVLTDWLDGQIARNTRQVTTLGKLLDPIADKLLISTALIALVQVGRAPAWMVVLIVGRELAITGLRTIAASQSVIIHASDFGKYKMLTEVAAVSFLILDWPPEWGFIAIPSLGVLCLWGAIALSIVSGIDYFLKFWKVIDLS